MNLQRHSTLTFNIVFDRLMKSMIATQKSETIATSSQAKPVVGSLDDREKNVVRYMGGYIAVKLLRRYSKKTRNTNLNKKWKMFVNVLKRMRAEIAAHAIT